jgi:hypothetical protein
MVKFLHQVLVDPVKTGDVFRLCHAGTEDIVMLDETQPLDKFRTWLDPDAASQFRKVWLLGHREASLAPGYVNKGQALRALKMCQDNDIEVIDA